MGKASKVPNCKTALHITHPLEKSITEVYPNLDLLNFNASKVLDTISWQTGLKQGMGRGSRRRYPSVAECATVRLV
jgi:hypothetical protein